MAGRSRKLTRAEARRAAMRPARPAAKRGSGEQIKVTRNSPRPQIKASRGPGGPPRRRKVAPSRRNPVTQPRSMSDADRRVAETRRQSLRSLGTMPPVSGGSRRHSVSSGGGGGGGSVRAVASSGGSAAARVMHEVVRPAKAVTRPVLRVVSGGLEALPKAAERTTPVWQGRFLILVAGVLAAGLIYVNVGKLEYGDGYARYTERALELQRENTALLSRIARLNAVQRIQAYAETRGMYAPAPEQYTYLKARRGDALKARNYATPLEKAVPPSLAPGGATAATGATEPAAPDPGAAVTTTPVAETPAPAPAEATP